jgi:HlyD family secretion protein
MQMMSQGGIRRRTIGRAAYVAVILVALIVGTMGVPRLKSASPVVRRSAIQIATARRGPMVRKVQGLGVLVPEEVRWLAAATEGHVDQVFLRAGARVKPETVVMQLSNPDLEQQLVDAELATKKVDAELANLRVQLQSQLLNERGMEAQLRAEAAEAKLQAERDEALLKNELGTTMNAKISRGRADSLATRLQIEKEKLAIAEEARQAQLAAKQAEVAQVQALYALKTRQKEALRVRAGISGVLEEVAVDAGQQVAQGTNLARVTSTMRLMARLHVPESQARDIQLNQKAEIQLQEHLYAGHVARIDARVKDGSVNVDIKLEGAQPPLARMDLNVAGTIEVKRVAEVLQLDGKLPLKPNARVSLYKVADDGTDAQRVMVDLGDASEEGVEILDGLREGDKVIVSDMSTWENYDHVLVK